MKKVFILAAMMLLLVGCGQTETAVEAEEPVKEEETAVEAEESVKEEEVVAAEDVQVSEETMDIILSAVLFNGQTIEEYVAELDDPTAVIYDDSHYKTTVTAVDPETAVEEVMQAIKDLVGENATVEYDNNVQNISITGDLAADEMTVMFSCMIYSDVAQAYCGIPIEKRGVNLTINGVPVG